MSVQASIIFLAFSCLCCCHIVPKKSLFCFYQQNKSSESKGMFRQISNGCKRVPEARKLAYANKMKECILSGKLTSLDFLPITNGILSKSAIPPLFNDQEVLSSASDKAKLFAKNFSENSNIDDSGISLPIFCSITNLTLHNISVTSKMAKKVTANLDSSKASGPDCIPVVVLTNCELELSYILAKLHNMCVNKSCFFVWRSHQWSLYLKLLGKGLHLRNISLLLFFLWLVKSLKNL